MEAMHIANGAFERGALFGTQCLLGGSELGGIDFERFQLHAIESFGEFEQRLIAPSPDFVDDFTDASMQAVGIRLRRTPQGSPPFIRG
jgi:hypothetical protein